MLLLSFSARRLLGAILAVAMLTASATTLADIRIGWGALPPFQYQDLVHQELKGPLIDVSRELAQRLGEEPTFVQDSWAMLPSGIAANKYRISLMAITDERARIVDFTPPLYHSDFTAVTQKDAGLHSWEDLNQPGRKIATTTGSGGDELLSKLQQQGRIKGEIIRIKEVGAAILALQSRAVDGYVNQRDILSLIQSKQPNLTILDGKFGTSLFGVAVPKGDAPLARRVGAIVQELVADGTMQRLINQYGIVGAVPGAPQ